MTIGQSGPGGVPAMSEVGANEAPVFVRGHSGAGDIFRRIAAVLVAIVMAVILFISAFMHAGNTLFSNETSTANQAVSAISTNTAKTDIADAVMTDIESANPGTARTSILAHAAALESVIRSEITAAPVRSMVRTLVDRIYTDMRTGTADTINLQPLVQQFLTPLHAADSAVSNVPTVYATSYLWHIRKSTGVGRLRKYQVLSWILTLVGIIGALVVARFLLRHRPVKMIGIFVMIGLPGLAVALFGFGIHNAASNKKFNASDNPLYAAVLRGLLGRAGTVVSDQGLLLVVVALGVMLLWGGWWLIRRQATPQPVGAP